MHKSGFINIIGRPNVGKSTLLNALLGERMSIITNKPQTTRHRIICILNDEEHQLVFSDTPGIIENPSYKMQETMNNYVQSTLHDADIMMVVIDPTQEYTDDDPILKLLPKIEMPCFLVINKTDLIKEPELMKLLLWWREKKEFTEFVPISALKERGTENLLNLIKKYTPEGPAFYPKDQITDRSERFFVSEIIREKILLNYKQEIPYSCEVIVESFKETKTKHGEDLVKIEASIFVARKTQKSIIIGKGGVAIKKLGTAARYGIEKFLQKKVFLELHVKVKDNWRDDERLLNHFGYGK